MIVDLHTHLWHSPDQLGPQISAQLRNRFADMWDRLDAGPQAHEAAMEPVDVAVVLGFKSQYLQAEIPNRMISEYVARRPERLIGFAGIDPMCNGWLDELESAPAMHFSGVAISPAAQNFHPSDTRAMRLYEKCEAMGLPVFVHQGTHYTVSSKMEYARPYLFDEVARSFPKLKIILAHCGHPWIDETLTLVGKHAGVYAELSNVISRSWQLYNVLLMAHQVGVIDRLLFGSDFPYFTPQEAIETMYSLNRFTQGTNLPSVPREKLRAIVERDALDALGLSPGHNVSPKTRTAAPLSPRPARETQS